MKLFYHCASGFYCDAENGLVFGKEGGERGSPNASGYKIVSYVDQHTGDQTSKPAHRIIFEAFTGYQNTLPSDVPVCHLDGCKLNNRMTNLEAQSYEANNAERTERFHAIREARANLTPAQRYFAIRAPLTVAEAAEELEVPELWVKALRIRYHNLSGKALHRYRMRQRKASKGSAVLSKAA